MAINYIKFIDDHKIYNGNKLNYITSTFLKEVENNKNFTNYNKFYVEKKFTKSDTNNKKFTFYFNKDLYHAFSNFNITTTNSNWEYVQLLVNNIPRSTITREQYGFHNNIDFNIIEVSKIFFPRKSTIPCDNLSIRIKFKNELMDNDNIKINFIGCIFLCSEEKKFFEKENEFAFINYRKQYFNLDLSKKTQSITINKNIPFMFISISFNHHNLEDSYEYLSIDDHEHINLNESSFESIDMENIDLIYTEKDNNKYWYNSCIDTQYDCSYFYPKDWKINFKLKNTSNYNVKGVIHYFIGNKIKLGKDCKGRLYYPINNVTKIEELPTNPFVKFNDKLYGEGYWHSKIDNNIIIPYANDSDIDMILPYPKQNEFPDNEFYKKLRDLQPFFKLSTMEKKDIDIFGDKVFSSYEYSFIYDEIEYKFPESYYYYLSNYNIHPSSEFRDIIETIWNDYKNNNTEQDKYKNFNFQLSINPENVLNNIVFSFVDTSMLLNKNKIFDNMFGYNGFMNFFNITNNNTTNSTNNDEPNQEKNNIEDIDDDLENYANKKINI
jgi:hypothetical protein